LPIHVLLLNSEFLSLDSLRLLLFQVDSSLSLLLLGQLLKCLQLLSLQNQIRVCQNLLDLVVVLLDHLLFELFLLLVELLLGFLFDFGLLLADVLAVALVLEAVTAVEALFEGAVQLLLLFALLLVKNVVDVVEAAFVLLQQLFFFGVGELLGLFDLQHELVVL